MEVVRPVVPEATGVAAKTSYGAPGISVEDVRRTGGKLEFVMTGGKVEGFDLSPMIQEAVDAVATETVEARDESVAASESAESSKEAAAASENAASAAKASAQASAQDARGARDTAAQKASDASAAQSAAALSAQTAETARAESVQSAEDAQAAAMEAVRAAEESGKSAYELWLEDNPGGTREDFYEDLRGPSGDISNQEHLSYDGRTLDVQAEATQSEPLQRWKDSSGNVVGRIGPTGAGYLQEERIVTGRETLVHQRAAPGGADYHLWSDLDDNVLFAAEQRHVVTHEGWSRGIPNFGYSDSKASVYAGETATTTIELTGLRGGRWGRQDRFVLFFLASSVSQSEGIKVRLYGEGEWQDEGYAERSSEASGVGGTMQYTYRCGERFIEKIEVSVTVPEGAPNETRLKNIAMYQYNGDAKETNALAKDLPARLYERWYWSDNVRLDPDYGLVMRDEATGDWSRITLNNGQLQVG